MVDGVACQLTTIRNEGSHVGMCGDYAPHANYKDSGVRWLADIPTHWRVSRLKYLATVNDEALAEATDPNREIAYVDIGNVDSVEGITGLEDLVFEDAPSRARRIVRQGDVIISTVRTYLRAIARIEAADANVIVSTGFAVVRPRHLDDGFMAYALRAPYFVERVVANSVGVSYPAINASDLACLDIAFPPLGEQRTIAAFLDRETAKIDALVAKKERLTELLQEKRTALISRAVTKGLDPNMSMKDSGVDWLGEIPEHWEVKRLKSFATVQLSNVDKKSAEGQDAVQLCNYTDVYYNEHIGSDVEFMVATATKEQIRRFSLTTSDVLITKDSEEWTDIAVPAVVTQDLSGVLCGYHLAHIRPGGGCDGAFLSRAFAAIGPRDQYQVSANGITRYGLTGDSIRASVLALPPLAEQRVIAAFLDRETAKGDELITKVQEAIERLKELRAALISAAVTGKIDVRQEAA